MARPKDYRHRVIFSSSIESNLLEEFEQLASDMKKPRNELIQEAMKLLIKQKKAVGPVNPLNLNYKAPHKAYSLLHYLQESIDSDQIRIECSQINDQKALAKLKGMAYTINQSADQQSMVLYRKGIKV